MNPGCSTTPKVRVLRGIGAAGFAFMAFTIGNVWLAIPFGLFAASLLVGAATGRCPNEFFAARRPEPPTEVLGYPVAVQDLTGSKVSR